MAMKHVRIKPPCITACDICLFQLKENIATVRYVHTGSKRHLRACRKGNPSAKDIPGSIYCDVCPKCAKQYVIFHMEGQSH